MSLTSYRAAPSRDTDTSIKLQGLKTPKGLPLRVSPVDYVNELYPLPLVAMPGDDLLFQRLSVSTIGAVWFHGRVRDGIGWVTDAMATKQWDQWMRVFKSMHTHP